MFQQSLDRYADQPRALLGAAAALGKLDRRAEAAAMLARADSAVGELREAGRRTEAGMIVAIRQAVSANSRGALQILNELLAQAGPGSAGWGIPIEPLLSDLRGTPGFTIVLDTLAVRAA
jgi:hypothetical protein